MRNNAVQLVHVQLIAFAQLTAGGAEAGQSECSGHIRTHLLHAARKSVELDNQQPRQHLVRDGPYGLGVAGALVAAVFVFAAEILLRDARILEEVRN